MKVADFAVRLWAYCVDTHASVTSWGRTEKHNRDVGGKPGSQHLRWTGADVVYDNPLPLRDRASAAERAGLELVAESDHDHLQARRNGA